MAADYYKTLGVSKSASKDEIRKAYKKLARENHPDVKPDDKAAAQRFKEASEAYDVLGDEEKRSQYDRFGSAYKQMGQGGPGPGGFGGGGGFEGGGAQFDINDLFGSGGIDLGDLFGGGRGDPRGAGGFGGQPPPQRPRKGEDARATIQIPFGVSAEGGSHELAIDRGGEAERFSVRIPAGIKDGATIRLSGQGHPGSNGAPAGDLLVTVHVAGHPYFRRDGDNVLLDLPITLTEAALGAKVDVPTLLEGDVTMTIPPGTASGSKLRLTGKGFPNSKTKQPGNQLVVIKIVPPKTLSEKQRELFEALSQETTDNPRTNLWTS